MIMKDLFIPPQKRILVQKGWGYEDWICNSERYCGKLLVMNKGKQLSWHYHRLKDETFYVEAGQVVLTYSEEDDLQEAQECILNPGDSFYIPVGLRHRLRALEDSRIFEFSTQHFESDSIRLLRGD